MPLSLRPAADADRPFLQGLFGTTRPEFDSLPEAVRGPLLAVQFEARQGSYAAAYPGAADRIVEENGLPIGRLLVCKTEGAVVLVDVALLPRARGRGTGGALVRRVIEEAAGETVKLSVVRGNPATRLYRRLGFVESGGDGVYVTFRFDHTAAPSG
jgi:GNAT superfamily N-acetyltransferase